PPLNRSTRGMVVTSYLIARSEFSSTFTLPTLTLPANWSAMRSMVGESCRHGPHHGAQKSTRTGWPDWATSACQFSDVNSTTFLLAIGSLQFSGWRDGRIPRAGLILRPTGRANQMRL